MTTSQKVLIIVLIIITVGLLTRYVVFKKDFDQWSQGLEHIERWQTEYKAKNPDATEEQMNADFHAGINSVKKWEADYKAEYPGATNEEVKAAFEAQWSNN